MFMLVGRAARAEAQLQHRVQLDRIWRDAVLAVGISDVSGLKATINGVINGVRLTEAGEIFLLRARRALDTG